ncbi:hypothetical protein G8764_00420 [Pseudomaricurvus alcaniphilus]|uniref:hypothetical protein n=1 Tax=Pseudomaricurvus alcaniphilus TaxID=1166482 RepID=UPI00140B8C43|nr:hypothetical protein [Pseudomaricurvus alcaniphilus]NHN35754.1 hypothetical protein [Pseudomaricurvus alcaniphilus]
MSPPGDETAQADRQNPVAIATARVQPAPAASAVAAEKVPSNSSVESSWIRPEVGQQEASLGARVESVESMPGSDTVAVGISLPPGDADIEEVTVYGRSTDQKVKLKPITQPVKFEVLNSPDKSGIVIYLPKMEDFVLKINYYESQPDVVPDLISDQ